MTNHQLKINVLLDQKNQLNKKIADSVIDLIYEIFDTLFQIPEIYLSWTQYTPYFNDGEPCEFGVYDLHIGFPEAPEEIALYMLASENTWKSALSDNPGNQWYKNIVDTVKQYNLPTDPEWWGDLYRTHIQLVNSLVESYKELFGDHAKVTLAKDEYAVTTFDHE